MGISARAEMPVNLNIDVATTTTTDPEIRVESTEQQWRHCPVRVWSTRNIIYSVTFHTLWHFFFGQNRSEMVTMRASWSWYSNEGFTVSQCRHHNESAFTTDRNRDHKAERHRAKAIAQLTEPRCRHIWKSSNLAMDPDLIPALAASPVTPRTNRHSQRLTELRWNSFSWPIRRGWLCFWVRHFTYSSVKWLQLSNACWRKCMVKRRQPLGHGYDTINCQSRAKRCGGQLPQWIVNCKQYFRGGVAASVTLDGQWDAYVISEASCILCILFFSYLVVWEGYQAQRS